MALGNGLGENILSLQNILSLGNSFFFCKIFHLVKFWGITPYTVPFSRAHTGLESVLLGPKLQMGISLCNCSIVPQKVAACSSFNKS